MTKPSEAALRAKENTQAYEREYSIDDWKEIGQKIGAEFIEWSYYGAWFRVPTTGFLFVVADRKRIDHERDSAVSAALQRAKVLP